MPEKGGMVLGGKGVVLTDLGEAAKELLQQAGDTRVWIFDGEMGSGKTTLIKAICAELGVKGGTSSPTFSIVNEYIGNGSVPIFHFDFYRLEKETEAYDMGIEEYFESGFYCFVEWADKIPSLLPNHFFIVKLTVDTATNRKIEFTLL